MQTWIDLGVCDLFTPLNSSMVAHDKKSALLLDDLVTASSPPEDFVVCTPTPLVLFDSGKLKTVTLVQLGRNVSS